MLLWIYKLDDGKDPICSFGIGEHMIGRGNVLQCMDKRVSRKHAEIVIRNESITITAKHEFNPCFYRAVESKHITILKYNFPVELSSGDTFGFFPDEHWFKIKISTEAPQENGIHKRSVVGDQEDSPNKRFKTRNGNSSPSSATGCSEAGENGRNSSNITNNLSTTGYIDDSLNNSANTSNQLHETNQLDNIANTSNAPHSTSLNLNNSPNTSNHLNSSANSSNYLNPLTVTTSNDEIPAATSTTGGCWVEGAVIKQEIPDQDVNGEASNEDGVGSDVNNEDHVSSEVAVSNQVTNEEVVVKKEINDDEPGNAESTTTENDTPVKIKDEILDSVNSDGNSEDVTNSTADTPSCSTTTAPADSSSSNRRDRCWYGNSCYRRHPDHVLKFSHQGDADYETDPTDSRPQCQYGAKCYRKNKQHRTDFKHSRFATPTKKPPPRKKPKTSPKKSPRGSDQDSEDDAKVDSSNIVTTKRARKAKTLADSPMDDYDYDDPFLDDGSEDDFQLDSEDSESD